LKGSGWGGGTLANLNIWQIAEKHIKGLIIELTLLKSPLLFGRYARKSEAGIQCLSGFPGQAGE